MNREEAWRSIEALRASPASAWIGNRVTDGVWLQKCMRCGAEATLALPPNLRGPEDVPAGFDEELFRWKQSFQATHEGCAEQTEAASAESGPAEQLRETPPPAPGVTMKRLLHCETHGQRRWQGHVMCDACGLTFQTTDTRRPHYAPETCRCGHRLLPPESERIGDALGLQTGGVVADERGHLYQTTAPEDWTARPICYLCYRRVAKRFGGRVPVDADRN